MKENAIFSETMSDKMLDLVARRFRTLGEPVRLRLIQQLESGEKTVGDLVAALDGNQPNVSKHLQILYEAGLLARRRSGTSILYSIADPMVFKLCQLVCHSETRKIQRHFEELTSANPREGKR